MRGLNLMGKAVGDWLLRAVILAGIMGLAAGPLRAQKDDAKPKPDAAAGEEDNPEIGPPPIEVRPAPDYEDFSKDVPRFHTQILRKGKVANDEDRQIIERVARWQLLRMTDPQREREIWKDSRDIIRDVIPAKNAPPNDAQNEYRKALIRNVPELLRADQKGRYFPTVVRVNAIMMLASLVDEAATPNRCFHTDLQREARDPGENPGWDHERRLSEL